MIPFILRTKLSVPPSIVEPFLATVRGLVSQSPPSAILMASPAAGVEGKVKVQEPPEVFAIIWLPALAV